MPFTSYPSMQYTSVEPSMSSPSYYSNQHCYSQYGGEDWYSTSTVFEMRKGPLEGGFDNELDESCPVVPTVCKRSRHAGHSGRSKGEELCVVCGDKASGYHYNALTCEGCKGESHNLLYFWCCFHSQSINWHDQTFRKAGNREPVLIQIQFHFFFKMAPFVSVNGTTMSTEHRY